MAVLFLSRGTFGGVQDLVDTLCGSTRARCISREDLIKDVSRYGDWATAIVEQLSNATSAYEQFSRARHTYIVLMRQALLARIQEDSVIYHGLSGHLLVPRLPHFVRVRICEPLGQQIAVTMDRMNCDQDSARSQIREAENLQVRWARFVYGRDVRDPTLYDLNINLGHFSREVTMNVLSYLLSEPSLRATPETRAEMGRLLRAADVEAALTRDPRTREYEIDCTATDTSLRLEGPYLDEAARAVVREVAMSVDPKHPIEYAPGYATGHRLEDRTEYFLPARRVVREVGDAEHPVG